MRGMSQPDLPFHVLIPAAGSGSRMGMNTLKQDYLIRGKPLKLYVAEIFMAHPLCASVTLIEPQMTSHDIDRLESIEGGITRQDSVYKGLRSLKTQSDDEIILVHDAARPFVDKSDIDRLLKALETQRAAVLAAPVRDSLCRESGESVERDGLYAVQTPQAFRLGDLRHAHESWPSDKVASDDASLVRALGIDVALVESHYMNDKITFKKDLLMLEALLGQSYETRSGLGFDVHAFEDAPSDRALMLCGVPVPHARALAGHSDADVGLHAITDALLGAISQGDIGRHFPPSNNAYKGMDSAVFLEKARDLVTEADGEIVNIDITLICETPKITPHAPAMIARIAEILEIAASRVSVKATTSEKLGFTGRSEGIAAQAIANVKVPAHG